MHYDTKGNGEVCAEIDNHAGTSVVSEQTALLIHDFNCHVQVHGYDQEAGESRECNTVSGVIVYDHPSTGVTYYLMIHQAILVPGLKVVLLSPMQMIDNGFCVNDEPKYMVLNPTEDHHVIMFPSCELDTDDDLLRIHLSLHGVTSYFPTRQPTKEEYESSDLALHIDLTSETPEWDPHDKWFKNQEAFMVDNYGNLKDHETIAKNWTA